MVLRCDNPTDMWLGREQFPEGIECADQSTNAANPDDDTIGAILPPAHNQHDIGFTGLWVLKNSRV